MVMVLVEQLACLIITLATMIFRKVYQKYRFFGRVFSVVMDMSPAWKVVCCFVSTMQKILWSRNGSNGSTRTLLQTFAEKKIPYIGQPKYTVIEILNVENKSVVLLKKIISQLIQAVNPFSTQSLVIAPVKTKAVRQAGR